MSECLKDILISELPRIDRFSYDDLLVIDTKRSSTSERFETHAISWGHLSGVYPPGGGTGGDDIDNEIILRGTVKFLDGTELRPSITFIKDDNTGFYRPGENTIGFTTGGSRAMVIKEERVGIGTDFPDDKLHVHEGNVKISLGMDENTLFLGSSTRNIGGDPSIQSLGSNPLSIHVDQKERLRITKDGSWGLSDFNYYSFGNERDILTSMGPGNAVRWMSSSDIIDLEQILIDIDNNMIGKGAIEVYADHDMVVGNTTMTSGISSVTVDPGHPPTDPRVNPNANSFVDSGWKIEVDATVVRTDGEQNINGKKYLGGEFVVIGDQFGVFPSEFRIDTTGNFNFTPVPDLPRVL